MEIPIRFIGRERAHQQPVQQQQPSYFEAGKEQAGFGGKGEFPGGVQGLQGQALKESGAYGQQQWQQPSQQQWQQQPEQYSYQKPGMTQAEQTSYQKPGMFQQQPEQSAYQKPGMTQAEQTSYQKPGIFQQKQPEQPSYQKPGVFQQQQQQPEQVSWQKPGVTTLQQQQQPISSMIGGIAGLNLKECQVNGCWSANDITTLYMLTMLEGHCYVKNHLAILLSGDRSGAIKSWHKNVTKKNLDALINLMHQAGLSLPFPVKLEDRENELKKVFSSGGQFSNALKEGECLLDIKFTACTLESLYSHGFMSTSNEAFRNLCRDACGSLTGELLNLQEALAKQPEFFPIPFVKSVTSKEGIWERR